MSAIPVRRWWLGAGILAAVLMAGAIGWLLGVESSSATTAAPEPVLGKAPSYRGLTNQLGRTVGSARFKGKVQVVTFLFPYCTTYCPLIAAHLVGFERLLDRAGLQNRVEIVAFNVDPAGTGPRQMRAFLKEYGWNPADPHWQYLTGQPKTIRRIVTGGFHVAYSKTIGDDADQAGGPALTPQPTVVNPLAEKAHVGYDITHNDGLVIVDTQGRIRRFFDQADVVSGQSLLRAIRPLLATAHG
jgi:protein SCO1/2